MLVFCWYQKKIYHPGGCSNLNTYWWWKFRHAVKLCNWENTRGCLCRSFPAHLIGIPGPFDLGFGNKIDVFFTLALWVKRRLCSASYMSPADFKAPIWFKVFPYFAQTSSIFLLRSSFFFNHVLNWPSSIPTSLIGLYKESMFIILVLVFSKSEIISHFYKKKKHIFILFV